MPTYIHLAKLTPEAMGRLKDYNRMLDDAKRVVESNGGRVLNSYSCLGEYDLVAVLDLPDNATAMRVSALIAAQGNFLPMTLATISPRDFGEALAKAK